MEYKKNEKSAYNKHNVMSKSHKKRIVRVCNIIMRRKVVNRYTLKIFLLSFSIICLMSLTYCFKQTSVEVAMVNRAFDVKKIVSLFCLSADDITENVDIYIKQAQQQIDTIIAIPNEERTFSNTAKAIDELMALSNLAIAQRVYDALELLSPEKDVRDAAHNAYIKI